jgi:hypothetical protein
LRRATHSRLARIPALADVSSMRFRTSLLTLLVAAMAFSAVAVAGNGNPGEPAKKQNRPGACHKKRAVALKGSFLEAGSDSFKMNVRKANRHGRALRGEQTVMVDDKTRIKRRGKEGRAALSDLVANDRLHVLARCKPGDTAGSFTLLARLVIARPAKPAEPAPEPAG